MGPALKLDPRNAELHVHHAQYLLEGNQRDKAEFNLRKAARFGADAPDTLYNLGVLYSRIGDFQQAKKCLLKASNLNKNDPQILITLGTVATEMGDFNHLSDFFVDHRNVCHIVRALTMPLLACRI